MQAGGERASVGPYCVKPMEEHHRRAVIDLFNYYVQNSFAAYPDSKVGYEFFDTLLNMCREHGALVAETAAGEAVGFALLKSFHPAATFKHTAEVSYFILPAHTRKGLGKLLLDRIIGIAKSLEISCLVASVSSRNEESLGFHKKWGFNECGHLRDVGVKFGHDFGVVWFQRRI
jgi:L-amino acid N-acyltransferase YncA